MAIQNNCPGCGREVQQTANSAGTPQVTMFQHQDHQGLWHYDCYTQAVKDGRTKPRPKRTCARCANVIQYSQDEFHYKNAPDGRALWMHGNCITAQNRTDFGIPTPGESHVKKYMRTPEGA